MGRSTFHGLTELGYQALNSSSQHRLHRGHEGTELLPILCPFSGTLRQPPRAPERDGNACGKDASLQAIGDNIGPYRGGSCVTSNAGPHGGVTDMRRSLDHLVGHNQKGVWDDQATALALRRAGGLKLMASAWREYAASRCRRRRCRSGR
jgi:hypothetical protein